MPKIQYEMRISRRTVDKLGVKLYDKVSAVIGELVSNSYDADATKVIIEAPMGQYLATHTSSEILQKGFEIKVIDNGSGMTPEEMQEFYLIVGAERRNDPRRGERSKKYDRPVTGRKGVGKLAPFGICKVIEIISAGGKRVDGISESGAKSKGYLTSHIILNYDMIVDDDSKTYKPAIGPLDQKVSPRPGTTTILREFSYRKVPDMDLLARQLAQRFGFPSEHWQVQLRDHTKSKGAKDYERKVGTFDVELMDGTKIEFVGTPETFSKGAKKSKFKAMGPNNSQMKDLAAGFEHAGKLFPIRGWVAYSKAPYSDDLMAGVRALAARMGYRPMLNVSHLPGQPDLVFNQRRCVVFVHGCFWHRHSGCKLTTTPKTRRRYWMQKFEATMKRDRRAKRQLRAAGWRTLTIWTCQLRDESAVERRLDRFLRKVT